MCDNAFNLNMHVEKDPFCLEFYLSKHIGKFSCLRQKEEDEGLVKTEFQNQKFKCQHCGEILKSADGLSTHIDNIHVAGKYSIVRQVVKNRRKKQENIGKYSCVYDVKVF